MRGVGAALLGGLAAPVRQWRLTALLWMARLLPVALFFGGPAFSAARGRSAHHPDAGLLLDPSQDQTGFAWAWTTDLWRDALGGGADTIFWLIVGCWLLVTVLAGGITARLVHGGTGLFLAETGRYAGRFVRLALVVLVAFYAVDLSINAVLAEHHAALEKLEVTQDAALRHGWLRGTLFVALTYLVGLLHAYARIEIVAFERRSALLAFFRGFGRMLSRFPALLAVEAGMLLAAGVAALVAWMLLRGAAPGAASGWTAITLFLLLGLVASYLRSGVEVGALEARCRVLVDPPEEPSQYETIPPLPPDEPDELEIPAS